MNLDFLKSEPIFLITLPYCFSQFKLTINLFVRATAVAEASAKVTGTL